MPGGLRRATPWGDVWVHWAHADWAITPDGTRTPAQDYECNPNPVRLGGQMVSCINREITRRTRDALFSAGIGVAVQTGYEMLPQSVFGLGRSLGQALTSATRGAPIGFISTIVEGFIRSDGTGESCDPAVLENRWCEEQRQRATGGN
jgi:hypothetical protein